MFGIYHDEKMKGEWTQEPKKELEVRKAEIEADVKKLM